MKISDTDTRAEMAARLMTESSTALSTCSFYSPWPDMRVDSRAQNRLNRMRVDQSLNGAANLLIY